VREKETRKQERTLKNWEKEQIKAKKKIITLIYVKEKPVSKRGNLLLPNDI
jgi:hypothetical protein